MQRGAAELIHLIDVAIFLLTLICGLLALAWGTFTARGRDTKQLLPFLAVCFGLALFFYMRILPLAGI